MASYTIYAADDGYVQSIDPSWATAKAGSGADTFTAVNGDTADLIGIYLSGGNYGIKQAFFEFDTFAVPDYVDTVSLSLYATSLFNFSGRYGQKPADQNLSAAKGFEKNRSFRSNGSGLRIVSISSSPQERRL